jgi:glycosyltransferase involved in cell wall biosynthesis
MWKKGEYTPYSLEKIQKHYKVEKSKVKIVPNGVDTEKFKLFQDWKRGKTNWQEPSAVENNR